MKVSLGLISVCPIWLVEQFALRMARVFHFLELLEKVFLNPRYRSNGPVNPWVPAWTTPENSVQKFTFVMLEWLFKPISRENAIRARLQASKGISTYFKRINFCLYHRRW